MAKGKLSTVAVRLVSSAGTGYVYHTTRSRQTPKLVLRKHDPVVNRHVLFVERKK